MTEKLSEAFHNLIELARPFMRDDVQRAALLDAETALAARAEARPAPVVEGLNWQPASELPSIPTDDTWRILAVCPAAKRKVQELWRYQSHEEDQWSWQTPPGVSGRGYLVLPEAISLWCKIPEPPALLSTATSLVGEGMASTSSNGLRHE